MTKIFYEVVIARDKAAKHSPDAFAKNAITTPRDFTFFLICAKVNSLKVGDVLKSKSLVTYYCL
jgi:hypothetical protein